MTFLRLYLQMVGLSLGFVGTGHFLYRTQFGRWFSDDHALGWAAGYFLGLSAFLPVFVFLSRLLGAEHTLWLVLPAMAATTLFEIAASRRRAGLSRFAATFLLLVLAYSVTNAALWVLPVPPSAEPGLFHHLGSIHSGRYANYAIFIADHDRVPYLAQNGGQSILASLHLLLGVDSPLAAVMVWVPFSMAFLTLLIFGLFRSAGVGSLPSAAATFLVMFCNVAISTVHVLLFDNGSPLAFIGYTDLIVGVATFVLFCRWFQARLLGEERQPRSSLLLPPLFGLTWAWCAPQNIVVAGATALGTGAIWAARYGWRYISRRFALAAVVFAIAAAAGAVQFGSLLPSALQENTGYWTQKVPFSVAFRPYVLYLHSHWTVARWNASADRRAFEQEYARAISVGADEVYRHVASSFEENLWDSVRIYGFPLLGLLLLGNRMRRSPSDPNTGNQGWRAWFWMSLFAFGSGYLVAFSLELGGMKWWLTRFLVPGSAMALTCLGFAVLGGLRSVGQATRATAWALLLVAATCGPVFELLTQTFRNIGSRRDPIVRRLDVIARTKGPFLFESLVSDPQVVAREAVSFPPGPDSTRFVIGGDGRRHGQALLTPPMPMRAGTYRIEFRVEARDSTSGAPPAIDLDVEGLTGNLILAHRAIRKEDLERRANGYWASLDVDLPREVTDAQFSMRSRSDVAFLVTAMRLERR